MVTRLDRLDEEQREEVLSLMEELSTPETVNKSARMSRLGEFILKADSYDPLPHRSEIIEYQYDTWQNVWPQASELRSNGQLLRLGLRIKCPVVAIHGDYDPHPFEGVQRSLSSVIKDFRFIRLEECGHHPWIESKARDKFFTILKEELL